MLFGGKELEASKIGIKKAMIAVARASDLKYPAVASAVDKIYLLGVFEYRTIKEEIRTGNSVIIHTGASKILTMKTTISGTGLSNYTLEELQELVDEKDMTVFVLDVNSVYGSAAFDLQSPTIPDEMFALCHTAISRCQIKVEQDETSNDIRRVKFSAENVESVQDFDKIAMDNFLISGSAGNDAYGGAEDFSTLYLSNLVDNGTITKEHLVSFRSMLWDYWDWRKSSDLTQASGNQPWNHKGLTLTNTGCAYDSSGFYLQDGTVNDGFSQGSAPTTTGSRFGFFVADFSIVGTVISSLFLKHGVGSASSDDGYYVIFSSTDTVVMTVRLSGGTVVRSETLSSIPNEDFNERGLRYFLFDFKTETIWYYNATTNTFATSTNSANNTLAFTDAGNGIETGLGSSPSYDVKFYRFGYGLF